MGETGKEQMEEKMKNRHSSHVRSPPSFQPWLRLWSECQNVVIVVVSRPPVV